MTDNLDEFVNSVTNSCDNLVLSGILGCSKNASTIGTPANKYKLVNIDV